MMAARSRASDRYTVMDCFWCGEAGLIAAGTRVVCANCAATYDRETYETLIPPASSRTTPAT